MIDLSVLSLKVVDLEALGRDEVPTRAGAQVATRKNRRSLGRNSETVWALAFSLDGQMVASGGGSCCALASEQRRDP
jgi:hypothetical protein